MHHFNRAKVSNNSLIRDQKSNKHIPNGYKKLVHTFKHKVVQLVAKNLAVNSGGGGDSAYERGGDVGNFELNS